jgi:hypothetical protein
MSRNVSDDHRGDIDDDQRREQHIEQPRERSSETPRIIRAKTSDAKIELRSTPRHPVSYR